ncbi:MAG: energy transducer TonB [Gammaproteobacteria bacterium]|nr:energy transducer TonB [Gammaproteobacteria bacterium]
MSAVPSQPLITPLDRMGLTICLAIITHAIIILGVTFTQEDILIPRYDTMDIILVQQKDTSPVDDARLLAQANLQGGGETADEVTPAIPLPPPFPDNQAAVTAPAAVEAPPPAPVSNAGVITKPDIETKQAQVNEQIVTETETANASMPEPNKNLPEQLQKQTARKIEKAQPSPKPRLTATELLRNSFIIASLSAEIKRKLEVKSKRPRRKFISASTREYKFAAYMEAWRAKVERVGNINYPDEARKRKLSGSLILDVALNPDGSINQITLRRSSGHKVLDDAAVRIVNLASPYAPFPENIRKDTDILHITRTWQFLNNRGFR